jgi:hypothetical protein
MRSYINDPAWWRERAEETRAKVEGFRLAEGDKQRLLVIAREYDQLADRAAELRRNLERAGVERVF